MLNLLHCAHSLVPFIWDLSKSGPMSTNCEQTQFFKHKCVNINLQDIWKNVEEKLGGNGKGSVKPKKRK